MIYKAETTTGEISSYLRAVGMSIENPLNGVPTFQIQESKVTQYPDGTTKEDILGKLSADMSDPTQEIDLVNPETGETVKTMTYAEVYAVLFSVYLSLAKKRDAAQSA